MALLRLDRGIDRAIALFIALLLMVKPASLIREHLARQGDNEFRNIIIDLTVGRNRATVCLRDDVESNRQYEPGTPVTRLAVKRPEQLVPDAARHAVVVELGDDRVAGFAVVTFSVGSKPAFAGFSEIVVNP